MILREKEKKKDEIYTCKNENENNEKLTYKIDTDENSTYKRQNENDENLMCKAATDDNDEDITYKVNTDKNGGFYHMPSIKSQIYIPDGALDEETKMQIIEHSQEMMGKETELDFKSLSISNIYEFLPHGQRFMKYVTFRFPLHLMHRFDVSGLKMLYSATGRDQDADWQMIPLVSSK